MSRVLFEAPRTIIVQIYKGLDPLDLCTNRINSTHRKFDPWLHIPARRASRRRRGENGAHHGAGEISRTLSDLKSQSTLSERNVTHGAAHVSTWNVA